MIRNASLPWLTLSFIAVSLWLCVIVSPAGASFVFQDVSITPAPPLAPGHTVSGNADLVIVPQGGSSTFVRTNQLELTTQLEAARWNVVVMVNGLPAAQMPVNGNTVFVNGFLLSYPVSSDVAVSIQVNGTVPETAGAGVTVIGAVQLNNAGQAVPGSAQSVVEPLQVPATPIPSATLPTQATPQPTPTPTKSPGFSAGACFVALAMCGLFLMAARNVRKR